MVWFLPSCPSNGFTHLPLRNYLVFRFVSGGSASFGRLGKENTDHLPGLEEQLGFSLVQCFEVVLLSRMQQQPNANFKNLLNCDNPETQPHVVEPLMEGCTYIFS